MKHNHPLSWSAEELERLRQRVRELMAGGLRRGEASAVAFGELVTRRALERAQADAAPPADSDLTQTAAGS
jgi:hypothetical protein